MNDFKSFSGVKLIAHAAKHFKKQNPKNLPIILKKKKQQILWEFLRKVLFLDSWCNKNTELNEF